MCVYCVPVCCEVRSRNSQPFARNVAWTNVPPQWGVTECTSVTGGVPPTGATSPKLSPATTVSVDNKCVQDHKCSSACNIISAALRARSSMRLCCAQIHNEIEIDIEMHLEMRSPHDAKSCNVRLSSAIPFLMQASHHNTETHRDSQRLTESQQGMKPPQDTNANYGRSNGVHRNPAGSVPSTHARRSATACDPATLAWALEVRPLTPRGPATASSRLAIASTCPHAGPTTGDSIA